VFDGNARALFANVALIVASTLYLICDILGYFVTMNPIKGPDLSNSLRIFLAQLKRLRGFSIVTSLLFGSAVILFMTSGIEFTFQKYIIVGGMILTLIISIILLLKIWNGRISEIEKASMDFKLSA
jgi:hypothetical protein